MKRVELKDSWRNWWVVECEPHPDKPGAWVCSVSRQTNYRDMPLWSDSFADENGDEPEPTLILQRFIAHLTGLLVETAEAGKGWDA